MTQFARLRPLASWAVHASPMRAVLGPLNARLRGGRGQKFDETVYLAAHPDVAAAVAAGLFKSGLEHYRRHGMREGRMVPLQSREAKALSAIDRNGLGLEIGPSHNPIAPKRAGYNVHILDHLDADGLRRKYAGHPIDLDKIEDVDFIWTGQRLPDLIGRTGVYDWIIASHVIEHVPDLVSFLQQCEALLKPDGKLSLVVPDKRYCFDYFNPVSLTGAFLDAYHEKRTRPSPGQVFDYFANASRSDEQITWAENSRGKMSLTHEFDQAAGFWRQSQSSAEYLDVHCWRFTPESFRLVLADLKRLGLIGMSAIREFGTQGCEFYLTLGKDRGDGAPALPDRLKTLLSLGEARRR